MDQSLFVVLVPSVLVVLAFWWFAKQIEKIKDDSKPSEELLEIIKMLQTGSKEDRKALLESLHKNTQALNQRLDKAAEVIAGVQRNIGEMSEIGRSMKELQDFLQSPKLRGNIGEEVLNDLISQTFPKSKFHLQYSFKSGEKVDAAIKTSAGIIPIDSKFPMENFQKMSKSKEEKEIGFHKRSFGNDVRKHIRDISKKYILPDEGTLDFALMYVPSEPVYYEIVNDIEIMDYARKLRIYPVSPTTLYAHLQMILLSFEGQKIEEKSRYALRMVRAIQKDYEKVEGNIAVLQKHINNAYNMMGSVTTSFMQLGQKITTTQSLGVGEKEQEKGGELNY